MAEAMKSNVAPATRAIARQETLRQNRVARHRARSRVARKRREGSVFFFVVVVRSPPFDPPSFALKQYFVSSGFAFVHADSSTDICAVEAVPVEQLDAEAVKKGLADYQAKLVNAKDDYEKASAQIGIEVCGAMNSALGN